MHFILTILSVLVVATIGVYLRYQRVVTPRRVSALILMPVAFLAFLVVAVSSVLLVRDGRFWLLIPSSLAFVAGVLLASYNAKFTLFEQRRDGVYFRPKRLVGLIMFAVLLVQLMVQLLFRYTFDDSVDSFAYSAVYVIARVTLGLLAGYYLWYYCWVLRHAYAVYHKQRQQLLLDFNLKRQITGPYKSVDNTVQAVVSTLLKRRK